MFSSFDCLVKGYRQKEDAWNAVLSGFMTGGWSVVPISLSLFRQLIFRLKS